MDPETTWLMVTDDQLRDDERGQAALDLLVWIAKGGYAPANAPGLRPRAETIETCELYLSSLLERV